MSLLYRKRLPTIILTLGAIFVFRSNDPLDLTQGVANTVLEHNRKEVKDIA
jgi:hypothetical protein